MKKRLTIVGTFLVVLLILIWTMRHRSFDQPQESKGYSEPNLASTNLMPQSQLPTKSTVSTEEPRNLESIAIRQARAKQAYEQRLDAVLNDWRTPIEFYGKVVDGESTPVFGAKIKFVCNDLSHEGTSFYNKTSNEQGLFNLTGVTGKGMSVHLSKEGYYTSKQDNDSFEYGDKYSHFTPDAANPIVFHLRKKGKIEPLIAAAGSVFIPKDGTPVGLSLTGAKIVPAEAAECLIQCWIDNEGKRPGEKFDWRYKITVPNGGLQEITEEFPFLAPELNYQASVETNMPVSLEKQWQNKIAQSYYLKLGNGDYGRIDFEMIPYGEHFAMIKSYLNVNGSRNLESEPSIRYLRFSK